MADFVKMENEEETLKHQKEGTFLKDKINSK